MRVVGIILARAGSKGIPNKNLATVRGTSLLHRAIRVALEVTDEVYVSSDSLEILNEACLAGATGVSRESHLSQDSTSSEAVIENLIHLLGLAESIVVFIQATSPFQDPASINEAVRLIQDQEYDSVFSATESHSFIWDFKPGITATPLLVGANPRLRRQDLTPRVLETGAFYVFRASAFLESKSRFHGRTGAVMTNVISDIEIDSPRDLLLANQLAELEREQKSLPREFVEKCRLLAYDFDGVMTDNSVYVTEDGKEMVQVNRGDGLAVSMFRELGFEQVIITTETNGVVSRRAEKLKLPILASVEDKLTALSRYCKSIQIKLDQVLFIGNDLNDLEVMSAVGFSVCPADGAQDIQKIANLVLKSDGGAGVIREVLESFINQSVGENL